MSNDPVWACKLASTDNTSDPLVIFNISLFLSELLRPSMPMFPMLMYNVDESVFVVDLISFEPDVKFTSPVLLSILPDIVNSPVPSL